MPNSRRRLRPSVFIDANILVAAVLSASGGFFRLLQESSNGNISLSTNDYAVDESRQALKRKYPMRLDRLNQLIVWSIIKIFRDPPEKSLLGYVSLINPEDAPILTGAIRAKAQFLVTLD